MKRTRRKLIFGMGALLLGLVLWQVVLPFTSERPLVIPTGPNRAKPEVLISDGQVLLLAPDGSLWHWGYQGPDLPWVAPPQRVGQDSDWAALSAEIQVIARKNNGTLWRWDSTVSFGQSAPQQISSETNWGTIAAGRWHSLALKTDGTLWVWGDKRWNNRTRQDLLQIGHGSNWIGVASQADDESAAPQSDGSLWRWTIAWQNPSEMPKRYGSDTNWLALEKCGWVLLARQRDGSCWVTDTDTRWPQLPRQQWVAQMNNLWPSWRALDPTVKREDLIRFEPIEAPKPLAARQCLSLSSDLSSCLIRRSDGTLWGVGRNAAGQLGDGTRKSRGQLVQVGHRHDWVAFATGCPLQVAYASVGVTADGKVWAWGNRLDKDPDARKTWRDVWSRYLQGDFHAVSLKPRVILEFKETGSRGPTVQPVKGARPSALRPSFRFHLARGPRSERNSSDQPTIR